MPMMVTRIINDIAEQLSNALLMAKLSGYKYEVGVSEIFIYQDRVEKFCIGFKGYYYIELDFGQQSLHFETIEELEKDLVKRL